MTPKVKFASFVGGVMFGAAAGTGSCLVALKRYRFGEDLENGTQTITKSQEDIGRFGFPVTGADILYYESHVLSYDQARRTPRWVAEHLTRDNLLGKADRKRCRFRPDPAIPACFTARNEDYLGSGWSRGHMAPAGDCKQSEQSMADTFFLSNIVPQNFENNAGFWNRMEMYCRDLTQRFDDVWVVSGPLARPTMEKEKSFVSYQVIGRDEVAVPTHLYKAILVQRNNKTDKNNNQGGDTDSIQSSSPTLALGAFIVPNQPIGFDRSLTDFQVSLSELEKASGLTLFPKIPRANMQPPTNGPGDSLLHSAAGQEVDPLVEGSNPEAVNTGQSPVDLCKVDGCKLMGPKEFTLFIAGRRVAGARSLGKLEAVMSELRAQGIQPDHFLDILYQEKKKELTNPKPPDSQMEV